MIFDSDFGGCTFLDETLNAQPAIFAISYALGKWWIDLGVAPEYLLGHSVGEFAAAVLAGVMKLADGAKLVALRGKLMHELPPGSMLAMRERERVVCDLLDRWAENSGEQLEIAAINAPQLCVVSGPSSSIERFADWCEKENSELEIACSLLRTSHAFHSHMMDPAVSEFLKIVDQVPLSAPTISLVSTVTGEVMSDRQATDPGYWARQIREPVRFSAALGKLLEYSPVLLEVGPSQALTSLARMHAVARQEWSNSSIVASLPHPKQSTCANLHARQALARLWELGQSVEFSRLHEGRGTRRVPLPGYPFRRVSHWFQGDSLSPPVTSRPPNPPARESQPVSANRIDGAFGAQLIQLQTQLMHQQMNALQAECDSMNRREQR